MTTKSIDKTGPNKIDAKSGSSVPDIARVVRYNFARFLYTKTGNLNRCANCEDQFIDHASWKRHMNTKHPDQPLEYCCGKCFLTFKSIFAVASHYAKCDGPVLNVVVAKDHKCPWCALSFDTVSGLGQHKIKRHQDLHDAEKPRSGIMMWDETELWLLAEREAKAEGTVRFINKHLITLYPNLTIDQLKGQRKAARYKEILADARTRLVVENEINVEREGPVSPTEALDMTDVQLNNAVDFVVERSVSATVARFENDLVAGSVRNRPDETLVIQPDIGIGFDPRDPAPNWDVIQPNENIGLGFDPRDPAPNNICESKFIDHFVWLRDRVIDPHLKILITELINGLNIDNKIDMYWAAKYTRPLKVFQARLGQTRTDATKYRRKIKLARYSRIQHMWRKLRKDVADAIMNDRVDGDVTPPAQSIEDVFIRLFSSESPNDEEPVEVIGEPSTTWRPIPMEESTEIISAMKIRAPGPDGFKVCELKNMDGAAYNFVLNFCLFRRKALSLHKANRTIVIPKTNDGRENAVNWRRPITISSVFVRALHKLMSVRLNRVITLNERQKAFVPVDGCLQNTLLLDHLIKEARSNGKSLNLVGIDLAKAFDSVSHHTIRRALRRVQIDNNTCDFSMESYCDAKTTIILWRCQIGRD